MTRIPIEHARGAQLNQANSPVEFFDATSGQTLGVDVRLPDGPILRPEFGCSDSEEEVRDAVLDALAHPGRGKPLAQIWKELGRVE